MLLRPALYNHHKIRRYFPPWRNKEDAHKRKSCQNKLHKCREEISFLQDYHLSYSSKAPDLLGFSVTYRGTPGYLLYFFLKELIDPAVQGTLNVLKASHGVGVRRVVVTSSIAAVFPNPHLSPGAVVDENSWTDIEYRQEQGTWYGISKTLAERAAWEFAEETGLDVIVVNPGCALGPLLQPRLNASSGILVNLIQGAGDSHKRGWTGTVHVQDVAQAHILVYETPDAKGRYLCTNEMIHASDLTEEVAHMYPQLNVYRCMQAFKKEIHPGPLIVSCGKLMGLGFTFTSREKTIRDAVVSLQDKGFLPK